MFYWIERQHDQMRPAIARFKVFYGHGEELQAGDLSLAGGARRSFTLTGIGDYMAGGFYYWGGAVNYLAQWVEPGAIRGNVAMVQPRTL